MFPVRRVRKYISIILFYYIDYYILVVLRLVRVSFYMVAGKKEITFPNNRNGESRESQKWHFLASTSFANARILINKRKKIIERSRRRIIRSVLVVLTSLATYLKTLSVADLHGDWRLDTAAWRGVSCRVASRLLSAPDYLSIRGTRDERSGPRRLLRLK